MTNVESRAGMNRPDSNGTELIGKTNIEIRYANLERDAARIAEIFSQPSAIEHISGMAPTERTSEVNVKRYAEKYPHLNIVIATEQGIKDFYKGCNNFEENNTTLLVAVDKALDQIVGTVTVERPTAPGLTYASISRLAVDEDFRGRGTGRKLLETASALALLPKEQGGYGQFGAQVGIIQHVDGYQVPQKMFQEQGYRIIGNPVENCVSWSNKSRRFVPRDTLFLQFGQEAFLNGGSASSLQRKLPRQK